MKYLSLVIVWIISWFSYDQLNFIKSNSLDNIMMNVITEIDTNKTFSQSMNEIIKQSDSEIQIMHKSIGMAHKLLIDTKHKETMQYCIELLRSLEIDYFSLQRKTIATLYEEREIMTHILSTYEVIGNTVRIGDKAHFLKIVSLLQTKVTQFRHNINQVIETQYNLINKAKSVENELLMQSIEVSEPSLAFAKFKLIFITTSGVLTVPAIIAKCGTSLFCVIEASFVSVAMESYAYDGYKEIKKRKQESKETSGILVQLSSGMYDVILSLEVKIQQYENLLHNIHQLESLHYDKIIEEYNLPNIKNKLEQTLQKIELFLE